MDEAQPTSDRIFDYLDYREFLRRKYQQKKKANASFSYRFIAGKVSMDAGSFSRVLKGERNLDPESADRLARVFGLEPKERAFFTTLVLYSQARSHAEKSH